MLRAIFIFLTFLVLTVSSAMAQEGIGFTLVQTSARDGMAVIKASDGTQHVVRAGDVIDNRTKVVSISANRMVLEQGSAAGPQFIIITIDDKGQAISRSMSTSGQQPQNIGSDVIRINK